MRGLRNALGLTQEKLAERAGLERIEVVNVESGRNQATSIRILKGLAQGFGLSLEDAMAFIDGELTVEQAAEAVARRGHAQPLPNRALAAELCRADGVYEGAIQDVLAAPVGPSDEARSTIWWIDRIRHRALEMVRTHAAGMTRVRDAMTWKTVLAEARVLNQRSSDPVTEEDLQSAGDTPTGDLLGPLTAPRLLQVAAAARDVRLVQERASAGEKPGRRPSKVRR